MTGMCPPYVSSAPKRGQSAALQRPPKKHWAGATQRLFGRVQAQKVGSLQPSPVFCPRPKLNVARSASFLFLATSVHPEGERNAEPRGDVWFSCHVRPPSL